MISYAQACRDPHLFGPWFSEDTWRPPQGVWSVIDKAAFGEPLDDFERMLFTTITGRDEPPAAPVKELWIIAGRRSGKDVKAASIAVYLATVGAELHNFAQYLKPGERGVVQLLAVDNDQAKVCLGYLRAMLDQPMLAKLVKKNTADGVELTNRIAIEITTNDRRRVRGRTVIAAILDETAFWMNSNSVNPDEEVYRALTPAMATIPNAMLIGISSPYARKGLLYKKYKKHYGKPGEVLVVKAPTWTMNPNLPFVGDFITQAFADDPASAKAEFGAEFRDDIEAFVKREVVEGAVITNLTERGPVNGARYFGFVDPSGGSADSMTLAIAHHEQGQSVLDIVAEVKPPFSPDLVVRDFCEILKAFGLNSVTGDRYGGEWPRERFRVHGIRYEPSELTRSEIYGALLPMLNSGTVQLLDNTALTEQLIALERRAGRSGRDIIDHAPGAHDDVANAAAGALVMCSQKPSHFTLEDIRRAVS